MLCQPSTYMLRGSCLESSQLLFYDDAAVYTQDIVSGNFYSTPTGRRVQQAVLFGGQPVVLSDGGAYVLQDRKLVDFNGLTDDALPDGCELRFLQTSNGRLVLAATDMVYVYDAGLELVSALPAPPHLAGAECMGDLVVFERLDRVTRRFSFSVYIGDEEVPDLDVPDADAVRKVFVGHSGNLLLVSDRYITEFSPTDNETVRVYELPAQSTGAGPCCQVNRNHLVLACGSELLFFDCLDFQIKVALRQQNRLFEHYRIAEEQYAAGYPIAFVQATDGYIYYQQNNTNVFVQFEPDNNKIEIIYHFKSVGQRFNNLRHFEQFNQYFYLQAFSDDYCDVFANQPCVNNGKQLNVPDVQLIAKGKLLYIVQGSRLMKFEDGKLVHSCAFTLDRSSPLI